MRSPEGDRIEDFAERCRAAREAYLEFQGKMDQLANLRKEQPGEVTTNLLEALDQLRDAGRAWSEVTKPIETELFSDGRNAVLGARDRNEAMRIGKMLSLIDVEEENPVITVEGANFLIELRDTFSPDRPIMTKEDLKAVLDARPKGGKDKK